MSKILLFVSSEESPSVEGFDKFLNSSVSKLGETCDSLGVENLGKLLIEVFEGIIDLHQLFGSRSSFASPQLQEVSSFFEFSGIRFGSNSLL